MSFCAEQKSEVLRRAIRIEDAPFRRRRCPASLLPAIVTQGGLPAPTRSRVDEIFGSLGRQKPLIQSRVHADF